MEERIALIGIMVENTQVIDEVNAILHDYGDSIVGRMGLPAVAPNMAMIALAIRAGQPLISAMTGKLGRLPGVQCKALYAKQ